MRRGGGARCEWCGESICFQAADCGRRVYGSAHSFPGASGRFSPEGTDCEFHQPSRSASDRSRIGKPAIPSPTWIRFRKRGDLRRSRLWRGTDAARAGGNSGGEINVTAARQTGYFTTGVDGSELESGSKRRWTLELGGLARTHGAHAACADREVEAGSASGIPLYRGEFGADKFQGRSGEKTVRIAERRFRRLAGFGKYVGDAIKSRTSANRYEFERRRLGANERNLAAGG